MAPWLSSLSENQRYFSSPSSSASTFSRSARTSVSEASSSSVTASSFRTSTSSSSRAARSKASNSSFSWESLRVIFCAASWSDQRSGRPASTSSASISRRLPSRSKILLYRTQFAPQLGDPVFSVFDHEFRLRNIFYIFYRCRRYMDHFGRLFLRRHSWDRWAVRPAARMLQSLVILPGPQPPPAPVAVFHQRAARGRCSGRNLPEYFRSSPETLRSLRTGTR